MATTSFDLNVRYEIYRFFTENCKAPSYQEIAAAMGEAEARSVPYEQVWELSKLWYEDRLKPDFAGRSFAEAQRIFEAVRLRSAFWRFEE